MDYRKILVTDGMSNDLLLFMTDAPMEKVVEFMISVKKAVDNGDNTTELYEEFKAEWLFKVLLDSEMETDTKEMARCIGWDRDFDLSMDYSEEEKNENWGEEICPHCDHVNNFVWQEGTPRRIKCKNCGEEMLLCSLCNMDEVDCSKCPYWED